METLVLAAAVVVHGWLTRTRRYRPSADTARITDMTTQIREMIASTRRRPKPPTEDPPATLPIGL